ncbi:unnamed protein product, partial [Coregonus sp. 'balchen']
MADSQRQRGEGEGDGVGGEDWACCQGPVRTGPGATALTDQAEKDGVQPTCPNNRVPVLQRCPHTEGLPPREREQACPTLEEWKRGMTMEKDERVCMPPREQPASLPTAPVERLAQKDANPGIMPTMPASMPTAVPGRKHTYALEPCLPLQGDSQGKEGDGNEREEEERMDVPAKRARLTNCPTEPVPEEVKNLKVCIELTGLRLSKPRLAQELSQWQAATQRSTEVNGSIAMTTTLPNGCPEVGATDRKVKVASQEDRSLKRRSEVNGHAWCHETFGHSDNERVVLPSVPLTPAHLDRLSRTPSNTPVRRPPLQTTTPALTPFHSLAPAHPHVPPTPPRLSDKRQRLKEHRRTSALGLGPPHPGPHPDHDPNQTGDLVAPRLRRHGDQDKPKGKRQCKTKHTSQRERERLGLGNEELGERREAEEVFLPVGLLPLLPPQTLLPRPPLSPRPPSSAPCPALQRPRPARQPPPPPRTPASRPMPPEARRLIVNKNSGETLLQRASRLGYEVR